MALHGSIKVNNLVIGWWSATRIGDRSPTGINTYVTEVSVHGRMVADRVNHRYDDGPVRLASLVLGTMT